MGDPKTLWYPKPSLRPQTAKALLPSWLPASRACRFLQCLRQPFLHARTAFIGGAALLMIRLFGCNVVRGLADLTLALLGLCLPLYASCQRPKAV